MRISCPPSNLWEKNKSSSSFETHWQELNPSSHFKPKWDRSFNARCYLNLLEPPLGGKIVFYLNSFDCFQVVFMRARIAVQIQLWPWSILLSGNGWKGPLLLPWDSLRKQEAKKDNLHHASGVEPRSPEFGAWIHPSMKPLLSSQQFNLFQTHLARRLNENPPGWHVSVYFSLLRRRKKVSSSINKHWHEPAGNRTLIPHRKPSDNIWIDLRGEPYTTGVCCTYRVPL